jgi:hypothetical protein
VLKKNLHNFVLLSAKNLSTDGNANVSNFPAIREEVLQLTWQNGITYKARQYKEEISHHVKRLASTDLFLTTLMNLND